jgi:hypothetical protein
VTILDFPQRSPEWHAARLGRLCASDAKDMLATIKSGEAAARKHLRMRLALERLTQSPPDPGFMSAAMQRGIDKEIDARLAYEAATGVLVNPVSFIASDALMIGCSPDGLIDDDGGLELKCPESATHAGYLRMDTRQCPAEHVAQIKHSLLVTGRAWWDFASFDDRFPEPLRLFIVRVHRTDVDLDAYEKQVRAFLAEVDAEYQALMTMADHAAQLLKAVS